MTVLRRNHVFVSLFFLVAVDSVLFCWALNDLPSTIVNKVEDVQHNIDNKVQQSIKEGLVEEPHEVQDAYNKVKEEPGDVKTFQSKGDGEEIAQNSDNEIVESSSKHANFEQGNGRNEPKPKSTFQYHTPCLPSDEPSVKKADETNSEPANIDVGDTNGAPFTNDETPKKIISSDVEKKDVVNGEPVEKDEVITEVKQDGKNEEVLAVENSQENVVNEGGVKGEGTVEKKGEIESTDKEDVLPPPPDIDHITVIEKNIPSFDEWKQQMLAAAEEEKEKTKHLGAQVVQTNGAQGNKQKTNKNRPNLAANSCGAKVISLNQEAQNPSAVLSENKDQYMIQPCKAKKW